MARIDELSKRVRERWVAEGLVLSPVNATDLLRQHPLLPHDYVTFLTVAGLAIGGDSRGFRFWLPTELEDAATVLARSGYQCANGAAAIIFADYLQESWWYCLWTEGANTGSVSLCLGTATGNDPQPPIGDLAEFLLDYLGDSERLYGRLQSGSH